MKQVNGDKSLNLFTAARGPVARGFIEVDMVIPIHLSDPHAASATGLAHCTNV